MENEKSYFAFISYSHVDTRVATWLHRKLEAYRVPAHLTTADGGRDLPARIFPVFRDREELPTSSELSGQIRIALERSHFLVVICSPNAAASRWVNEEIVGFKKIAGGERILALVVAGEPNATDKPGSEAEECFPEGLRYQLDENGDMSSMRTEPIAADMRIGGDGKSDALLKLIAGLLGVGFDDLKQRDLRRRHRRMAVITAVALGLTVLTTMLAVSAVLASRDAEAQREVAVRTLANSEFLLGIQLIEEDRSADGMAHLARSIRVDPSHRAAADALLANLVYRNWPQPISDRELWNFEQPMRVVTNGDASLLAVSSVGQPVRIYDRRSRELVVELVEASGFQQLEFHPRLDLLSVGMADGDVQPRIDIYNPRSGQVLSGYDLSSAGETTMVFDQTFSTDGKFFAVATGPGGCLIWPVGTNSSLPFRFEQEADTVVFSGDDTSVVLADTNRVFVREFSEGTISVEGEGTFNIGSPVGSMAIFGDEAEEAVIASWRGSLAVWDLTTGESFGEPLAFAEGVRDMVLSEEEQILLMIYGNEARAADAATLRPVGEPVLFVEGEEPFAIRAAGGGSGQAVILSKGRSTGLWSQGWALGKGAALPEEIDLGGRIDFAQFSASTEKFVVRGDDGVLSWMESTADAGISQLATIGGADGSTKPQMAQLSASGVRLLTVAIDHSAMLFEWREGKGYLDAHPLSLSTALSAAAFSGDDEKLFLGYQDGRCEWRDGHTGARMANGPVLDNAPRMAVLNRTGDLLAVVTPADTVSVYRSEVIASESPGKLFEKSLGRQINRLVFDEASELLICATGSIGEAGAVHFLSTRDGQPITASIATPEGVHDVALDQSRQRVAVATHDGIVRVWQIASAMPLTPPLRIKESALAVRFAQSDGLLKVLSSAGSYQSWGLPGGGGEGNSAWLSDLAEIVCRRKLDERGLLLTLPLESDVEAAREKIRAQIDDQEATVGGDAKHWARWILESAQTRAARPPAAGR